MIREVEGPGPKGGLVLVDQDDREPERRQCHPDRSHVGPGAEGDHLEGVVGRKAGGPGGEVVIRGDPLSEHPPVGREDRVADLARSRIDRQDRTRAHSDGVRTTTIGCEPVWRAVCG